MNRRHCLDGRQNIFTLTTSLHGGIMKSVDIVAPWFISVSCSSLFYWKLLKTSFLCSNNCFGITFAGRKILVKKNTVSFSTRKKNSETELTMCRLTFLQFFCVTFRRDNQRLLVGTHIIINHNFITINGSYSKHKIHIYFWGFLLIFIRFMASCP